MNKFSSIIFLSSYKFLLQIFNKTLDGEEIPIRELKMLSSRFSGKSHCVEDLFALLLIQTRRRVVMNYIRARNADIEKAQMTIEGLIHKYQGGTGLLSNKGQHTMSLNKSKIQFITLNEEKEKVQKTGGKIGLPIERDAEYIITFYEECSQLNKDLVENLRHSVRGNENTKYLFIYASNPWVRSHWFIDDFISHLPESKDAEYELLEKGYNATFDTITKTLYYRPRYTLNPYLRKEQTDEIERLKDINYNKWRIVSLGFSGNLNGAIYEASLKKLNEKVENHIEHQYVGGVDWGDGKSAQGSPSVAYFGGISVEKGIDLYAELEHWNNKGEVLDTEDQIEKICKFYITCYEKVQKPITVYVDNAALGDFYQMFNTKIRQLRYSANEIEFLPAFKPKNTWERVETVNSLMSLGILRYNRDVCKGLYKAMENCYEVAKEHPTESMKRERSHEWTHWLHALEYLIGRYMKDFQQEIPMFDSKSINGSYGIY